MNSAKPLKDVLGDIKVNPDIEKTLISGLEYDSRRVKKGNLFFAVKGTQTDGHLYLADVQTKGSPVAIVENPQPLSLPQVKVRDVVAVMAPVAARFFEHPSKKIPILGVTGTNGKTTVTYIMESLLAHAGKSCGVMGTINYRVGNQMVPAPNTTPLAVDVQRFLAQNVEKKSDMVVMEVSSHALELHRVDEVEFQLGVFTNLTQDHLDFHRDMESYFRAKSQLFLNPKIKGVVNRDDPYGERLLKEHPHYLDFGMKSSAQLCASQPVLGLDGVQFDIKFPTGDIFHIHNSLLGLHNIYNCLAAAGAVYAMGINPKLIANGLNQALTVPGRLERVEAGQKYVVVVDYAHTHDALSKALKALQEAKPKRLICLFGAGGDRDRGKRPKMGQVATHESDFVYVTSDNPRTEDPKRILDDIEAGIKKQGKTNYTIIPDRREAIFKMIEAARAGDIILLAGKGHEDYQVIGTKKNHFSDQATAREAILHK